MKQRSIVSFVGLPVLAALTLAVASCGGGGSGAPSPTIPAGALVVETRANLLLDKSAYTATATAGQVVIAYVSKDAQRHTLLVKDSAGILIGKKLEVVKTGDVDVATYTLAPGTYTIFCDVPGHGTMKGTLVVS